MPSNVKKQESEAIAGGSMRRCPFCAELVKSEAIVCKHCGKDLPPMPVEEKKTIQIDPDDPYAPWDCIACGNHNERGTLVCSKCAASKMQ